MTRADLAAELEAARRGRFTIASRKAIPGALSIDAAYALGEDLERERVSAGWRPAGWKLGFTCYPHPACDHGPERPFHDGSRREVGQPVRVALVTRRA